MEITRTSVATDITRTVDMPITMAELLKYEGGASLHDAFPGLDADQREFILTGITADEWNNLYKEVD